MDGENSSNNDRPRGRRRSSGSFWFPIALITMGVIFLLQQIGDFTFENWWALFILIPAFSAFGTAFALWRRSGHFSLGVWSTFFGGLFPLTVALIFLFNLPWEDYWPVFIILAGIGMINSGVIGRLPKDTRVPKALRYHQAWSFFIGLAGVLLGLSFLGLNLNWFESVPFITANNWWAVFIIVSAIGGLVTAILLLVGGHSAILAVLNLAAAALVGFVGFVALNELDWELINMAFPVLLILVGIGVIVGFRGRGSTDS